ncbi:MAG: hypothetical protein Unbinned4512contig1001_46 [Prokaryotic dsDNA virus sp.]|nr:MAG: hypothetical protein Unbinned4512contig1001_46 [Prokaryotic dsDNA virus sp.]|tara:strand:- start:8876 stop:9763 length:888 start_codon:yes stop_codon:yes gene_type:complete
MGIGSSILNYFNEPAESNESTYAFDKAMGEDTIEANRNPTLATIGQFIKKYSPDLPILGPVFGQGIGDYLINSGYNRTKGQVLKDTAFGMLDFADIAGTGFLLKQGLKKPMYNSDMYRDLKPAFHATNVDFDTFKNPEIGFHFAATPELAENAAKLSGKDGATARPYMLDTTNFVKISDQPNRFDPYQIVDELQDQGYLKWNNKGQIQKKLDEIEEKGIDNYLLDQEIQTEQSNYLSSILDKEGIEGFTYDNVYDAYGEASRFMNIPSVAKELKSQGVQPAESYIVLDNKFIRKK